MSTSAEDWFGTEENTDAAGFEIDPNPELEASMKEYESLLIRKKLLEIQLRLLTTELDACVDRLKHHMNGRKAIRAANGWTAAWVHRRRKAYVVAEKEWDAFEIRSPF
jgi:hypothetical protein